MKNNDKTNVMRVLDSKKIKYESHSYDPDPTKTGEEIAATLGEVPERVVPVKAELDLKKAAKAAGEKSITMIKQKDLLPLTGYVHGGCSPVGMKKHFPTFIHETAVTLEKIYVSAGKVGFQIELLPEDLIKAADCKVADIAAE